MAIAKSIATDIITKLSSPLLQQFGSRWKFNDYMHDLQTIVCAISAVLLDAEEKSATSKHVEIYLETLKEVLYDADDLLDDIHTEALRRDLLSQSGNKLTKQVRVFFSSSNQFAYGLNMGREIKAINARLSSIRSEANLLGLGELEHPVETPHMFRLRLLRQTHSYAHEDDIIGREDDKAALLRHLLEFESEENVYIIPIVGIGGLGKTALGQLIYNNELVRQHFDLRIWVCVSDVFDVKVIIADIIKSVTTQALDQYLEFDQLANQLQDIIDGRKYLLVLDDIWNEEWEKWSKLENLLIGGAKGSRIIVTTRSMKVAEITSRCQPHVLKPLSRDVAWLLFKKYAFRPRSEDSINPALVKIGKQILERCGGVPLVIRTIAGTLSFKETEFEWLALKNYVLSRVSKGDQILATLRLSYDHLPSHLKCCFAYCRLYPKDHEIDVRTLIQCWIAQGFIKQLDPSWSLEETGFLYFKDLFERSFFQEVEAKEEHEGRETCKMHDLMHDLAASVAGKDSNILESDSSVSEVDERCRHISINPSLIPLFRGKKLRTLLHLSNKKSQNMTDAAWDFIISNLECLRVLELDYLNLTTIPCSIHKLRQLRYFDLSSNGHLKILPHSICKLLNLQVLKLDGCRKLEELPQKIEKLVNLTHLLFNGCDRVTHMPRGIGKLTSLQTLSQFVVDKNGSHSDAADLSELGCLNNLRGELKITNLGFLKNVKKQFMAANLKEKQHLRSLVLEWSNAVPGEDDEDRSLEDLLPHPNLQKLVVDGWRGDATFPSWLPLLTNLTTIKLLGPSKFKHLQSFAQLPHLQRLMILNLSELKYMDDYVSNGGEGESESFFPSLTSLTLRQCPNMKSWWREWSSDDDDHDRRGRASIGTSRMAFPRLSYLHIEDCPMTSMPLYPSLDEELTLINTSSRPLMQTIQMNTAPSTSSPPLSKLKSLHVDNVSHLVSLPLYLYELKRLYIRNCSGLKSLFPAFKDLRSLERLEVRDCMELELSADCGTQILQDYTSLRYLFLQDTPKCCHLPKWLQHITNLRLLYLVDLPNLRSLPDEMRCLTKLEELNIINNPQLNEICRKNTGADWPKIAHIPHIFLQGTRHS